MVRWNVDSSGLSCDPRESAAADADVDSINAEKWAAKYALYCVTQSGEPVNLRESPDLSAQLNAACQTTPV